MVKSRIDIIEEAKQNIASARYEEALDMLFPLLNGDMAVSFEYAKVLYFLKMYEPAINILKDLRNKYPENNNVLDILSKSYKESGKIEEFVKVLENSLNDTNIEFCLELANEYYLEKNYLTAAKFYAKYLNFRKEDVNIASKLAQIYNFTGQKNKAAEICSEYMKNKNVQKDKFLFNLFLNELEIAQEKIILESTPRIMLVALTNRCNLNCPMCATRDQANCWDISENFKTYILKNLPTLELITWQGGEVFLYKGFEELFLEASKNKYLKQIIITNGLLLNEHWINLLFKAKNLDITISIDNIEKESYEKIRRGAKFETLLENLKYLREERQREKTNISLTMRITISDENIYNLDKIMDFAIEYKFDIVILSPLDIEQHNHKKYNFHDKSEEDLKKINELKIQILTKSKKNNIKVIDLLPDITPILDSFNVKCDNNVAYNNNCDKTDSCNAEKIKECETEYFKVPFCLRPWRQLATTVHREIRPECLCLENIEKTYECENFEEIWNNKNMQEYRKKLINLDKSWCCKECINNTVSDEHKKFVCI